mmetsp:Transcript_36612/g.82743  ORF Transcript_36612/g.82743 Transcript_36612/m.82743 type:complete len:217 (-) Transcript_36612:993-1643(-)
MNRIYFEGWLTLGTSAPRKPRIRVQRLGYSQSSMNSQRWSRPFSRAAGTWAMTSMSASTKSDLNSTVPSSRRLEERKVMRTLYFDGYITQRPLTARTTSILNTTLMSDMKVVICFTSFSTLDSCPVFSKVVRANVAVLRFESVRSGSISQLHLAAMLGLCWASMFRVRIAPKRTTGLGDVRKICRIVVACVISYPSTVLPASLSMTASWQKALAAS